MGEKVIPDTINRGSFPHSLNTTVRIAMRKVYSSPPGCRWMDALSLAHHGTSDLLILKRILHQQPKPFIIKEPVLLRYKSCVRQPLVVTSWFSFLESEKFCTTFVGVKHSCILYPPSLFLSSTPPSPVPMTLTIRLSLSVPVI